MNMTRSPANKNEISGPGVRRGRAKGVSARKAVKLNSPIKKYVRELFSILIFYRMVMVVLAHKYYLYFFLHWNSGSLSTVAFKLLVWSLLCHYCVTFSTQLSALAVYSPFYFWLIRSLADPTYTSSIFVHDPLHSYFRYFLSEGASFVYFFCAILNYVICIMY